MMKFFLIILAYCVTFTFSVFSGPFEESLTQSGGDSRYLETEEDKKRLGLFSAMYDLADKGQGAMEGIPKVFHVVWLGPAPFPEKSIARLKGWMERHKGWKLKFWTDLDRPFPNIGEELRRQTDFPLKDLKDLYYQCDNFGERSMLLRYAVLLEEGGVFIDHDTECRHSLDLFLSKYDFFCGMEPLGPTILSSSVNPSPHIIGAAPGHPILQSAKGWLKREWEKLENNYPGKGPLEVFHRVQRRSFRALGIGIQQSHNRNGRKDVVLPPHFLSLGRYATHLHEGTWYKRVSEGELKVQRLLSRAVSETSRTFVLSIALTVVNVCLGTFMFFRLRKKGILFLFLFGCLNLYGGTFEELMGSNTSHWRHIEQPKDWELFYFSKALYEKNQNAEFTKEGLLKIPPVVHFIWLGPRPFPAVSVENVRTWMAQNPGWKVKFWTDRDREPPCEGMERCFVKDFHFLKLQRCFEESQNYGEQSDILRFEILCQQGGVYVDHDANCLRPFEEMHRGFDFFCCLETPHEPFVGRAITCGIGVIGSRPRHPTVEKVMDLILNRWDALGEKYRGRDEYSKIEVVMQRTYIALTDALRETIDKNGNVDTILPAAYFFSKSGIPSLYSKHFYGTVWDDFRERKTEMEKSGEKALSKMLFKNRQLTYLILGLIAVNAAFLGLLLLKFRRNS